MQSPPASHPGPLADDLAEIWAVPFVFLRCKPRRIMGSASPRKKDFLPLAAARSRDHTDPLCNPCEGRGGPHCRALPTRDTAARPAGIRPQGLDSNFSPNRAAATRPRWAPVLGGGQVWREVPSRAAWGAEPGWREVPSPGASSPRHSFPPQLQWEGKRGCGGCGSLLGPPRARGTGCGGAGFSGESGVSLTPSSPSALHDAQPA